jgi:general secretion pathway protein B
VSLILDALRKADAERERGSVPSLHSQPVAPPSAEAPPRAQARPNWLWIAIGIAVGLSGAAAWVMLVRTAPQPGTPVSQASAPPAASVTAPGAPTAPVAASPVVAIAPAAPSSTAAAPAVAEPAPWPQPDERKAAARPEAKGDAPVRVLGNVPAAAEPQVYTREQLPPDIRAALPQFAIGGSMYSPNPAARSLIVNGHLYREKDRLTPDLTLEEVKLKAAVFSFRGYRFEVMF